MGLKANWTDKHNGQDIVDANDINDIAAAVIDSEDAISANAEAISKKMPAMSEMGAKPTPVITDRFPLQNQSDGEMKKVRWSDMISAMKKSIYHVESADTAAGITDIAESGYTATIPELDGDATIALIGDVESALAEAKANGDFTPVKGVDYWTEADKAEIVEAVLSRLAEQ